jgi:hypothetical protein
MPVPSITAITAAPSGTNQLAIASNELVYASANSGATFAATGLGQNNSPFIYIPFDGSSVADVMGNSVVTATGSPAYVTGKVGTNAVNLANTAGGTATQYLRGAWTGFNSFTVSFWFNAQTLSGYANLFITANATVSVFINAGNNVLMLYVGGTSINGPVISTNTWYNVTAVYQNGGTSSLYVNNAFYASGIGSWNAANITVYGIGAQEIFTAQAAFNGYIDDFRLYNYAVTNPSGAALINPLVGPIMPFVYLTFDGSTTTDVMGNSTVTATGSPGYVVGQVGSTALNLVNTAGGTATRYVRGTWTGAASWTVSLWVNSQSAGARQILWGAYQGWVSIEINPANQIIFVVPNGVSGSTVATSSAPISLNTWYHVMGVFQSNGLCILYVNGTLIGTYTNSGGVGTLSTTSFGVGAWDTLTSSPFNGYVDDFRIYTGAFTPSQLSPVLYSPSHAVGSPNIYLPFENGSVLDVMGYSAVSARGTMNFVPGVVGTSALNLVNPVSGNPNNYVYASWAGSSSFTVSGWVNVQGFSGYSIIFSAYNRGIQIYTNYGTNTISAVVPSGSSTTYLSFNPSSPAVVNTWYSFTLIFQTNGLCSFYVNNQLAGSGTNSGGFGSFTNSGIICLGGYDTATASGSNAFSGYIDDVKIYNSAVPFNALGPMNYTQAAISNSGAYQVVAAANGGVYTSANNGSTWSQAVTSPQVASAVNTVGGQVITPQSASLTPSGTTLTTAPWTQNGVTWVASASSSFSSLYAVSNLFNNALGANNGWANSSANYTSSGNTASQTTTIQSVGITTGEWVQIQSSVPLVMASYQFATGSSGVSRLPKTYYIVGSNDGSTWYLIQYGAGAALTTTAVGTLVPGIITVYNTGIPVVQTFGSSTITTAAYSTASNAYTYFRMVFLSIYGAVADYVDIGEWVINFATPPTPLYVAPSTALLANQSLTAITVMPQQRGLASNTWTMNGISWISSASSTFSVYYPYLAFDNNTNGSSAFYTGLLYNGNTGAYTGSVSTTVSGVSPVPGEWLQLQSSAPLVMSSYTFACTGWWQLAKTGFIVGSTDGTTWFPIQSFTMTTNPFTTNYQTASNYITIGPLGTQTQAIYGNQAGSGSFTGYATSSNAYTYFRFIASTVWGATTSINAANNEHFGPNEWFINFTAYTPALLQSLSMSPSGQYMALTGAGATAPNLTGLTGTTGSSGIVNSWTTNGVTWISSASNNTNPASPWHLFNNSSLQSWVPTSMTYSTTGNTSGTSNTFFTNGASTLTVQGDWAQLQSSIPLVMASYGFGCGYATGRLPKTYYIIGSNDGVTWYAIQSGIGAAAPTVAANYSLIGGTLLVNSNSVQPFGTSTITTTTYSAVTIPFLYFRLVNTSSYNASADFLEIGEWYINFQSGANYYSTDYGSSWTRSLTAATIPNANVLATSGNGQYSLQASGQTVIIANNTSGGNPTGAYTTPTFSPALSSATGAVSNAAVSATGQYMVVLIQSTSNNVYYSSNYGVSFTGITLGSTAMVSCAVSADGSYITVANATQVFTLNSNTQGLSITVGNQSGLTNQGLNAVAIGNQAGQTNQSANSIVLNASGAAVNAYVPGFFVAPVLPSGSSLSGSFAVLGYGTDNQVVQTGMTMLSNGFMGIGATNPAALLEFGRGAGYDGSGGTNQIGFSWNGVGGGYRHWIISRHNSVISNSGNAIDFYLNNSVTANGSVGPTNGSILGMSVTGAGVGIGTTAPGAPLHVVGSGGAGNPLRLVSNTAGNEVAIGFYRNPDQSAPITGDLWVAGIKSFGSGDRNFCIGCSGTNNILTMLATGTVGIGATAPGTGISAVIPNAKLTILGGSPGLENGVARISIGGDSYHYAAIEGKHIGSGSTTLSFMTCASYNINSGNPETRMFIANDGKVGIGITTPVARLDVFGSAVTSNIEMFRCVLSNGNQILSVFATANTTNGGWNGFDTVLRVTRDVGTSRSINAAGSINANGADYAEYMTKDSDFSAQKGDILGVLPSGKLTNQYDDAIHFLLKSTNPCMVGGDVWGTEAVVGEKPKEPEKEATEEEKEAHAAALAAWKARLEAERQKVDRMAFAGQVPVNILGATPGNYIIPLRNADGSIGVAAVSQADMSFSQYQRAVGRVISILEDGRANVIVKAV